MKRTLLLALSAALLTTGSASAFEISLQTGAQEMPDPEFQAIASDGRVSTFGLRFSGPLKESLGLSWLGGYEYASAFETSYADIDGVSTNDYSASSWEETTYDFRLHGVEAGLRMERAILPWLRPYASLSGRAYLSQLSIGDSVTGWEQPDPEDPTGETALYTVPSVRDTGFSGGVQVAVGLAIVFPPRHAKPIALAMAPAGPPPPATQPAVDAAAGSDGVGTEGALMEMDAVVPEAALNPSGEAAPEKAADPGDTAPAAPMAPVAPAVDQSVATPEVPTPPSSTDELAADAGGETVPVTAFPMASPTAADTSSAPSMSRLPLPSSTERAWGWGLNLEMGYSLLSDLTYSTLGTLDMGGLRITGGISVLF